MLMGLPRQTFHVIRGGPRTESVMNRALTEIHQGIVRLTLAKSLLSRGQYRETKTVLSDAEVRYAMAIETIEELDFKGQKQVGGFAQRDRKITLSPHARIPRR
jgi:hypothetical protein